MSFILFIINILFIGFIMIAVRGILCLIVPKYVSKCVSFLI